MKKRSWISDPKKDHDHVIFQFFFLNNLAKISTFLFDSVKMGFWVYINEKKKNLNNFSKWLQ